MRKTAICLVLFFSVTVSSLLMPVYGQTHSSYSHSTRASAPMGHTAYSRSGTQPSTPKPTTRTNTHTTSKNTATAKTFRPGITHSAAVTEANKKSTEAGYQAHKVAEKKKADEAKKKATQPEFHSVNTRISPPTPKSKQVKPAGVL